MQCQYVYNDGRQCQMQAQVLGDSRGWCINHDPTRSEAETREWKRRGGRSSKKVEPADVPSLRQLLVDMERGDCPDDVLQVKRILIRAMSDLLDAQLSPTQFRALCGSGISILKDIIALDFYKTLVERVSRLEGSDEPRQLEGGDKWQESRLEDS